MKILRLPSLRLSLLLQLAPVANVMPAGSVLAASPLAIVLKWFTAVVALGGAVHAVSGATARLVSPTTASGTVGTAFTYKAVINDGQNRTPGAWTLVNMPTWLKGPTTAGIFSGTPDKAGVYKPTITAYEHANKQGAKATFTVTITIADNPALAPPVITMQPVDFSVNAGQAVTFNVAATSASTAVYQWFFNGSALAGAKASSLTLTALQESQAGGYHVVVTNASGSVTSRVATLVVRVPPVVTASPASTTVVAGQSVTLSASVTGTAPLAYQWRRNGVDLPGATAASLTLASVSPAQAGTYQLLVSNGAGAASSGIAMLTVLVPPTLTVPPQALMVAAGQSATLSVTATGTAPLAYQWKHDGADLPGQNSPTLVLGAVTAVQAGNYQVVVSNAAGSVASEPVVLTVTSQVPTLSPKLTDWRIGSGGLALSFVPEAGITYQVESADSPAGPWQTVQSFGPTDQAGPANITIPTAGAPLLFVRLRAGP